MNRKVLVITPVKDSIDTTIECVEALLKALPADSEYRIYNDFSTEENTLRLTQLSKDKHFRLVNLSDLTTHPSPNYLLTLRNAQRDAVENGCDLMIVESDVIVKPDTIDRLQAAKEKGNAGLVAAVTVDANDEVNYPFEYAKGYPSEVVPCKKHISFCCTLLTHEFLSAFDFNSLPEDKSWYDVTISHKSLDLGFVNLLDMETRVEHRPHASRPWKHLKKTNPLKYYWLKLTKGLDKI